MKKVDKIWLDGALVPWDDAKVHVLTHTLHYGLGVFEGIRCYKHADGRSAIFRLQEHIQRLFDSAKIALIPMPWSIDEVNKACVEIIRANNLEACYLRPIAFMGDGTMGLGARDNPTRLAIAAWEWGAYLGEEGLRKGIRAKISSYCRASVNTLMSKGKIVGHYVNSILAKREAMAAGYDEGILLDSQGYVSEASGENIFLVKNGTVITPPFGMSILGGITRDTLLQVCADLQIPVEQRLMSRDELYIADEVFLCGTAAEVTPIREVDDRTVGRGERGPLTQKIQGAFFEIANGTSKLHSEWYTYI